MPRSIKSSRDLRVRSTLAGDRCRSSTKKMMVLPRTIVEVKPVAAADGSAPVAADAGFGKVAGRPDITRSKNETGVGLPLTFNSNWSAFKPSTKWPSLSKTMTSVCTRSVLTRMTSASGSAGFCGLVCAKVAGRQAQHKTRRKPQLIAYFVERGRMNRLLLFSQIGDGLLGLVGVSRFGIELQIFFQLVGCFFVLLCTHV